MNVLSSIHLCTAVISAGRIRPCRRRRRHIVRASITRRHRPIIVTRTARAVTVVLFGFLLSILDEEVEDGVANRIVAGVDGDVRLAVGSLVATGCSCAKVLSTLCTVPSVDEPVLGDTDTA